jgi:alkylated DNA repair dioxygenase AlkB
MSVAANGESLDMIDAEVTLYRDFLSASESDSYLQTLIADINWKQETIRVPGKIVPLPRLTAWYGDAGATYSYSGITVEPDAWIAPLSTLKQRIEAVAGITFNSVLLNYYRDGSDSVGWHSDDELELGINPVIASLSLGAAREFQFKHRTDTTLRRSVELTHGSLLIMAGATQHHWKHQIPKTKQPISSRINLTFRVIEPKA